MDVLHVIVLFERIAQAKHLTRHDPVPDRDCIIGNKRKPLPIGTDACVLECFSYGVELIVGSGNKILILLGCQLLRASFQGDVQQPILVNARARDSDLSLSVKHVRDAATRREVAVVLGENSSDLSSGAVSIVCRRLYDDRHAAGRITFISNFVELFAILALTRAAFDRAFYIIIRHALSACRKDPTTQTRIGTRIAAAGFRREGDFLRSFAEDLAAFGVDRALKTFDLRPFAMSRHRCAELFKPENLRAVFTSREK